MWSRGDSPSLHNALHSSVSLLQTKNKIRARMCVCVCQCKQQSIANNISTCLHKFKYYCYCLVCAAFYFISIFYFIVSLYAVLWSHPLSMVSFTLSIAVVLQWKWFINHTLTTHYKQHKFSSTKKIWCWWSFFICQTHMYRDKSNLHQQPSIESMHSKHSTTQSHAFY